MLRYIFICAVSLSMLHSAASKTAASVGDIMLKLDISAQNITSTMEIWDRDYAIMFYAPWCQYCKQLAPSWQQIAVLTSSPNKPVTVGTFNCEQSKKNTDLCLKYDVDRYPSIYFIGYGNFYQNHLSKSMKSFSKALKNRVVRFNADIYPEALYDWVNMLTTMSKMKRKWDGVISAITSLVTGRTARSADTDNLITKIKLLENKLEENSKSLEKYQMDEVYDSLKDLGDPYPLLAELEPDEQNLPFRACVADMVTEYCKYHSEEKHCRVAEHCSEKELAPKACRPNKCPFKSHRGCVVTSLCLDKTVIKEYIDEMSNAKTSG